MTTGLDERAQQAAALQAAHQAAIGRALSGNMAFLAAGQGWTPEFYRLLQALGEHADRVGTGATRPITIPGLGTFAPAQFNAYDLYEVARGMQGTSPGRDRLPDDIAPWLTLLASHPDDAVYDELLEHLSSGWRAQRWMLGWRPVPAECAALAYAAGLDQEEAHARYAAGTMTVTGLRTLAGLQGYRLPSLDDPAFTAVLAT